MRRDAWVEMNRRISQRCKNDISPRPKISQALIRRRSLTLAPFEKGAMRRDACIEMNRGILQRCKNDISSRPKIPQALIRRGSPSLAPFKKGAMRRDACIEKNRGILQRYKCGMSNFIHWKHEVTHSRLRRGFVRHTTGRRACSVSSLIHYSAVPRPSR